MSDVLQEQRAIVTEQMFRAVQDKDKDFLDLCLRKGADINAGRSSDGCTVLMMAAYAEDVPLFKHILTKTPDLFVKNAAGQTVFKYVEVTRFNEENKRAQILRLLVAALPDVDAPAAASTLMATKEEITTPARIKIKGAGPAPDANNNNNGGLNF